MKRFTRCTALPLLLVLAACDSLTSTLEPAADDVPIEQVLDISQSREPPQMPADGESVDTVYARIPARASTRVVEFGTTKGTFYRYGAVQSASVRAVPEGAGRLVAAVALRADTIPGTAIVRATVSGITRFLEVEFVQPAPNQTTGGSQ